MIMVMAQNILLIPPKNTNLSSLQATSWLHTPLCLCPQMSGALEAGLNNTIVVLILIINILKTITITAITMLIFTILNYIYNL